jgi:hypothetical protein
LNKDPRTWEARITRVFKGSKETSMLGAGGGQLRSPGMRGPPLLTETSLYEDGTVLSCPRSLLMLW